jgi:hypothetical protein
MLFGAEGRGIISYGTSIFFFFALLLSFNLGRGFIVQTERSDELRQQYLRTFFLLNIFCILLTCIFGLGFYFSSESAHQFLTLAQLLPLLITSIYYVWSINGNTIFAAVQLTTKQEKVIIITRAVLVMFLVVFYFSGIRSLETFLWCYSVILSGGVVFEWFLLRRYLSGHSKLLDWESLKSLLKQSMWPHVDYVAFNIFGIILILISALYLDKSAVGRVNFTFQFLNIIFLLSTTASLRIKLYVSTVGFGERLVKIKKLLVATLAASLVAACAVIPIMQFLTTHNLLSSFSEVDELYKIAIFSIPGLVAYQFLYPLWLESKLIKLSATANLLSLFASCALSPLIIDRYGERGTVACFSLFHVFVLAGQLYVYWLFKRNMRKTLSQTIAVTL